MGAARREQSVVRAVDRMRIRASCVGLVQVRGALSGTGERPRRIAGVVKPGRTNERGLSNAAERRVSLVRLGCLRWGRSGRRPCSTSRPHRPLDCVGQHLTRSREWCLGRSWGDPAHTLRRQPGGQLPMTVYADSYLAEVAVRMGQEVVPCYLPLPEHPRTRYPMCAGDNDGHDDAHDAHEALHATPQRLRGRRLIRPASILSTRSGSSRSSTTATTGS